MSQEQEQLAAVARNERVDYSKRFFLASLASGALLAGAEIKYQLIFNLLKDNNFAIPWLGEGNYVHKLAILDQLIHQVYENPHNQVARNQLKTWSKLNAIAWYARKRLNYPLSASLLEHFLYAEGKMKDVTADLPQALRSYLIDNSAGYTPYSHRPEMHFPEIMLAQLFSPGEIHDSIVPYFYKLSTLAGADVQIGTAYPVSIEMIVSGRPKGLKNETSPGELGDLYFALNNFTIRIIGELVFLSSKLAEIRMPEIIYYDFYDWKTVEAPGTEQAGLNIGASLQARAEKIGLGLPFDSDITISRPSQQQVQQLVERGLAHEFEIYACYKPRQALKFPCQLEFYPQVINPQPSLG